MFEQFTDCVLRIMKLANDEAQRLHHEYIGTEHMLLGMLMEDTGVAAGVLKNLGLDVPKVRAQIEKPSRTGADMVTMGKLPLTPRAKKVIEYAIGEARNLGHNYVGSEHLLLGLLRERDGVAAAVLVNMGLDLDKVREEVLNLFGTSQPAGLQASPPRIASIELPPNATASIREVLQQANEEAYRLGHTFVGTAHLLLAVVKQKRGAAIDVLRNLEVDLVTMRLQLDDILEPGPDDAMEIVHVIGNESDKPPELPVTPSLRDVLHLASVEAHRLNHNYVGTEHLLLGMLNAGRGPAAVVLRECSVTLEAARSAVKNALDK